MYFAYRLQTKKISSKLLCRRNGTHTNGHVIDFSDDFEYHFRLEFMSYRHDNVAEVTRSPDFPKLTKVVR
jgi:hypothetical protein